MGAIAFFAPRVASITDTAPMISEPIHDHGQELESPTGKVIGFFDDNALFDLFARAVFKSNIPKSAISSLEGEDGIQLLERLKEQKFFFGDGEDEMIKLALKELSTGHLVAIVKVADRDQALEVAQLAQRHEGHNFTHFGTWVNEQLPT